MPRMIWAGSLGITMRTAKITIETRMSVKRKMKVRFNKKEVISCILVLLGGKKGLEVSKEHPQAH
jgi:hypothetical protein